MLDLSTSLFFIKEWSINVTYKPAMKSGNLFFGFLKFNSMKYKDNEPFPLFSKILNRKKIMYVTIEIKGLT